jgi:two-component system phosphate regulon response regulator PhoB
MTDLAAFDGKTPFAVQSTPIDGHIETTLRYLDIELDWRTHRATRARRPIHLSTLDLKLLRFLMLAPGQVFTRAEILEHVWPKGVHVCERTVDVHMTALRKELHVRDKPDLVRTVRGRGYSLDCVLSEAGIDILRIGQAV